ncbi:hypothetical protein ABZ770_33160 [Streptomyces sp. NPDC006654]|uniref:hypothetical protein n=1 Tax=unclassified Streptomyces TaxID=2593676 RepID=UPI0033D11039
MPKADLPAVRAVTVRGGHLAQLPAAHRADGVDASSKGDARARVLLLAEVGRNGAWC